MKEHSVIASTGKAQRAVNNLMLEKQIGSG